jgi:hypothetical protein
MNISKVVEKLIIHLEFLQSTGRIARLALVIIKVIGRVCIVNLVELIDNEDLLPVW